MPKKECVCMSQPITVSVTMDAASFRRFRWFDLL